MGAAVPFAIQGGAGLIGYLLGKKMGGPSKQEQALSAQGAGAAGSLLTQAGQASAQAAPLLGSAANYYQRLLQGTRADMNTALQPEISHISDAYRGASKALDRSNIRGASRDVAEAELARDRAGKIGGLGAMVRPQAAAAVRDMGEAAATRAGNLTSNAGSIYSTLLGSAQKATAAQNAAAGDFGKTLGTLTGGILKEGKVGKKSETGGGA